MVVKMGFEVSEVSPGCPQETGVFQCTSLENVLRCDYTCNWGFLFGSKPSKNFVDLVFRISLSNCNQTRNL